MPKSKRSKACDISPAVKKAVYERDGGCCVICGRPGLSNMHYVPRSSGGLGIEENVVTACIYCHEAYDNGYDQNINLRRYLGGKIRDYLMSQYAGWDAQKLYYQRCAE